MNEIAELPMRDLSGDESPDYPVGTLMLGEPEHGCCHEVAIRKLIIFDRGDGSRLQMWNVVAEFMNLDDAEICLRALGQ